jgi:hypothetical protein
MNLTFTLTKLGGGVVIKGDSPTIHKVERLLTRTAIESHACYDNGMCMILSRYFEKKGAVVDWITLIAGVAALRHSLGYRLNRENHALMCLLEYEISNALCKILGEQSKDAVESTLYSLYGLSDRVCGGKVESRMVYLYLLKTQAARKEELLKIIQSISPTLQYLDRDYRARFEGLNQSQLHYPAGTEFEYTL